MRGELIKTEFACWVLWLVGVLSEVRSMVRKPGKCLSKEQERTK